MKRVCVVCLFVCVCVCEFVCVCVCVCVCVWTHTFLAECCIRNSAFSRHTGGPRGRHLDFYICSSYEPSPVMCACLWSEVNHVIPLTKPLLIHVCLCFYWLKYTCQCLVFIGLFDTLLLAYTCQCLVFIK